MATSGKRALRGLDPLSSCIAIFVLSVLIFNAAESRSCFNIKDMSRKCIANVKAEHGLNLTGYGGLGIKSELGRVYTYGCFQLALEDSATDCIDSSFALSKVNVTSHQQAVDIGNAFQTCFKSRTVSWRQDFFKRPVGGPNKPRSRDDFRSLQGTLVD